MVSSFSNTEEQQVNNKENNIVTFASNMVSDTIMIDTNSDSMFIVQMDATICKILNLVNIDNEINADVIDRKIKELNKIITDLNEMIHAKNSSLYNNEMILLYVYNKLKSTSEHNKFTQELSEYTSKMEELNNHITNIKNILRRKLNVIRKEYSRIQIEKLSNYFWLQLLAIISEINCPSFRTPIRSGKEVLQFIDIDKNEIERVITLAEQIHKLYLKFEKEYNTYTRTSSSTNDNFAKEYIQDYINTFIDAIQ